MESSTNDNNNDEIKKDDDDVFVEDEASPPVASSRKRSNSVIDSVPMEPRSYEWLVANSGSNSTTRSKDTSSDVITPDLETTSPLIFDAVDAQVKIMKDDPVIKRSSTPIARMPVTKDAECYNMNHQYRGKCVIFNQEEFDMDSFDKREGSTADANRLSVSFGKLGFEIEVCQNYTHIEVMDKIDKLSKLDHTNNDCICIIVLTHGLHSDLLCAKDAAFKSDKIWKPFLADKCTTLAGKPKLFFFQACRGDELDSGVVLSPRCLMSSLTDSVTSYKIPTHADFLIAHSSAQNFYTWRNPAEGTWYIQCLCDILDEYGTKLDLLKMLTITARKIATDYASCDLTDTTKHDKKQVPSMTSLLIRDVYFTPKSNVGDVSAESLTSK